MRLIPRNRITAIATVMATTAPFVAAAQQRPKGIGEILNNAMRDTAKFAGFFPDKGEPRTFVQILGGYTQGIITVLGLIFMVLIIWGGFKWMTAAGNEEQVTKAKGVIRNATIGLALILLARMITTLFINLIEPAVLP